LEEIVLLEIKNLSVKYGEIQALHNINIKLKKNEIVAIVGNNGAGKTSLINTITGIVHCYSGEIIFNNENITNFSTEKIVQYGIIQIPEGREIFSELTIKENLELGAYQRFNKENKEKIFETLEEIYNLFPILKNRQNQIAGTLSGGEQQMLAIGRGLMAKPKVMLLDEPSLGLAPLIVEEVFNVVKKLRIQGVSVLIVEQNAYAALKNSDRAYIMETGKITIQDNSENLLNNEKIQEAFLGKRRN
jgi:branched-chain amino acid transport system ATP-binding protein